MDDTKKNVSRLTHGDLNKMSSRLNLRPVLRKAWSPRNGTLYLRGRTDLFTMATM